MVDDKITLDKRSFKALASGTRVDILKSLAKRRKTLTEISKQFGMSVSTVKEHMGKLSEAGLVEMIDDGHKWKYYELTRSGKSVVEPGEQKIWLLLSVSMIGLIVIGYDTVRNMMLSRAFSIQASENAGVLSDVISAPGSPEKLLTGAGTTAASAADNALLFDLAGIAAFTAVFLVGLYLYMRRVKRLRNMGLETERGFIIKR